MIPPKCSGGRHHPLRSHIWHDYFAGGPLSLCWIPPAGFTVTVWPWTPLPLSWIANYQLIFLPKMEKRLDFENNFNIQKAFYNKFWPSLSIIIERSFKKYSQLKITFFHYTAVYEYAILKTLIYMKFFKRSY